MTEGCSGQRQYLSVKLSEHVVYVVAVYLCLFLVSSSVQRRIVYSPAKNLFSIDTRCIFIRYMQIQRL